MADVMLFRLKLRSPGPAVVHSDSEVVAFPYGRRRHLVERHANALRRLSADEGEAYLTRVLENLCDELKRIGIQCEDCQCDAIDEFAEAIGKELHGPKFTLEEVAQ